MKTKDFLLMIFLAFAVLAIALSFSRIQSSKYDEALYRFSIRAKEYDLKKPKQRFNLPSELREVSGLSFFEHNKIGCIQDEKGVLFIFDTDKGEVIRKYKFGDNGDYEGLEIMDRTAYVLKSNGDVCQFEIDKNGPGKSTIIKTPLSKRNNAEGLAYSKNDNELLIACKGDSNIKGTDKVKGKAIYALSLPDNKFPKYPKYTLKTKNYNEILNAKGLNKKSHTPFRPSGIAVHPQTGNIFVIAHDGKMLIKLTPRGVIDDLIPLDAKQFVQPEGICFSPDGDLYISSEGKGRPGYILKF